MDDSLDITGGPVKSPFPYLVFSFAVVKDFFDIASFGLGGWIGSIMLAVVIFIWVRMKSDLILRRMLNWLIVRYLGAILIGFIPGLNFVPEAMILVVLIHLKGNKIVALFYGKISQASLRS